MDNPVYEKLPSKFGSPESTFQQTAVDRSPGKDDQSQRQESQTPALEPSTLTSHPLRADDVTCFLPKVIG